MKRRKVRTICERQHRSIRMWAFSFAALIMLILTNTCDAHADTWDVAVTCDSNPAYPCAPGFGLTATVTTEQMTGTFYDEDFQYTFTGTVPVVTGATGIFDGVPFSFTAAPYDFSGGQWLNPYPENVWLGPASFFQVFDDTFMYGGPNGYSEVAWYAQLEPTPTSIPEPAEWIMLLGGLDALLIAGWFRTRRGRI